MEVRETFNDLVDRVRRSWLLLYTLGAAGILVILLLLLIGVIPGLAALTGVVLGALPWIYDRTSARRVKLRQLGTIRSCGTILTRVIGDQFPAFVRAAEAVAGPLPEWAEDTVHQLLDSPRGTSDIDSGVLQDVADLVVARVCSTEVIEELGPEMIRCLVLHVARLNLDRVFRQSAKSIVKAYIGEQLQFGENGVSLTPVGDVFVRSLSFLEEYGRIADLSAYRIAIAKPLGSHRAERVAMQIADPQLSFLVYELGKADDLAEMVRSRMSGSRLVSRLSRQLRRAQGGGAGRFRSFLVLKQEFQRGERYIKSRIDSVDDRIVSAGTLYHEKRASPYQSVSVLTMPYPSRSGKTLFRRHFSGLTGLTGHEATRASLVVVPLATNEAYYYPEDPSVLGEAQQGYFHNWMGLFGRDRDTFQELLVDFDVSFLEIIRLLSLDFLVRNLVRGEREYLQSRTDRVLSSINAKSLLDVCSLTPASLAELMRRTGYPHYNTADLTSFIESYTVPLKEFLDSRLLQLSTAIVQNAERIRIL